MEENYDVLDILLDENNHDPIIFTNEDGEDLEFAQVCIVLMDDILYCVLTPITEIEDVENDEAIVFRVDELEDGKTHILNFEENEETAIKVFQRYYDILEEAALEKLNKKKKN